MTSRRWKRGLRRWNREARRVARRVGPMPLGRLVAGPARRVGALAGAAAVTALAAAAAGRSRRRWKLAGRTVLITGGSRGLGLVLARACLARGARVAICARDGNELSRAYEDLLSRSHDVLAVPADLADPEAPRRVMQTVERRFGGLDVLVNNAGVIHVGPVEVMTEDDWREAMDIHLWAPLRMVEAALPRMMQRGGGRVVNIVSVAGRVAVPHLLPYTVTKHALTGLSRGLRAELARHRVRVLTVFPGLMRTGSVLNAVFKGQADREFAWFNTAGNLPLLSISETAAARRILKALEKGEAELVLGGLTKALLAFHDRVPDLAYDLLTVADRLLPAPGGIGTASARGHMSFDRPPTGWTARRAERAARRNNELKPARA